MIKRFCCDKQKKTIFFLSIFSSVAHFSAREFKCCVFLIHFFLFFSYRHLTITSTLGNKRNVCTFLVVTDCFTFFYDFLTANALSRFLFLHIFFSSSLILCSYKEHRASELVRMQDQWLWMEASLRDENDYSETILMCCTSVNHKGNLVICCCFTCNRK